MPEETLDFSQLESKYSVKPEIGYDKFVVVDGAPKAPAAKVEALTKVLKKVFSKAGTIVEPHGFYLPTDASGNTQGYVFIEFASEKDAKNAIKMFDHKKLDPKHTLLVNKLSFAQKALEADVPDVYEEPKVPPFKPLPHLRSWLTDEQGRDQAVMHRGDNVGLYWFRKDTAPKEVVSRVHFTDSYVQWSPRGTYIASLHGRGVALHGGPKMSPIGRFTHHDVRLVDFSPDERFLVTASKEPITAPPEDSAQARQWPFKATDEGNHIVVWDIQTFAPLRTFPLTATNSEQQPEKEAKLLWPAFKWSANSKYLARVGAPNQLTIYETPKMSMVNKKPIEIRGIMGIEFAPATVDNKQLLAYWTPEFQNQSAKVCIMDASTGETIRNRGLFNVTGVLLKWQNEGKFLCSRIDRMTKNKKSTFSILEIYRLTEKDYPVDVIELKDNVISFAWEPNGDRFVSISLHDAQNQALNTSRNTVSFYALEREKGLLGGWKEASKFENRGSHNIHWSPYGRFLVTTNFKAGKPIIEFWDVDYEGQRPSGSSGIVVNTGLPAKPVLLTTVEHFGVSDIAWDPSGRYLVTSSSIYGKSGSYGYKMWAVTGQPLWEENIDKLKAFLWRPRPASILPKEKVAEISKSLKKYAAEFEREDAIMASEESRELLRKRDQALAEWATWRRTISAKLESMGIVPEEQRVAIEDGKLVVFHQEVIEETVEEVID